MLSLFKKFKDGLTKTVSAIAAKTSGLFGGRKIDAASLEELEEALYTADFGVETTTEILAEIRAAYKKDTALQGRQAAEIGAQRQEIPSVRQQDDGAPGGIARQRTVYPAIGEVPAAPIGIVEQAEPRL